MEYLNLVLVQKGNSKIKCFKIETSDESDGLLAAGINEEIKAESILLLRNSDSTRFL